MLCFQDVLTTDSDNASQRLVYAGRLAQRSNLPYGLQRRRNWYAQQGLKSKLASLEKENLERIMHCFQPKWKNIVEEYEHLVMTQLERIGESP